MPRRTRAPRPTFKSRPGTLATETCAQFIERVYFPGIVLRNTKTGARYTLGTYAGDEGFWLMSTLVPAVVRESAENLCTGYELCSVGP